MMHGQPLSATLPEDSGLGERFWYWRGASGQRYIHSIYRRDLCPKVPGAVFVLVRAWSGSRRPMIVGCFTAEGTLPASVQSDSERWDDEVHVHLLARDQESAKCVMRDLLAAMNSEAEREVEVRPYVKPLQLDLLAA